MLSVIKFLSSCTVCGVSLYTKSFKCPQRKKSKGFRSGEYGAQTKSVLRLITLSLKFSVSHCRDSFAVWGGAPSCISHWDVMFLVFLRRQTLNLFNISIYRSEVTDLWAKNYGVQLFTMNVLFCILRKTHYFFQISAPFLFFKLSLSNLRAICSRDSTWMSRKISVIRLMVWILLAKWRVRFFLNR